MERDEGPFYVVCAQLDRGDKTFSPSTRKALLSVLLNT